MKVVMVGAGYVGLVPIILVAGIDEYRAAIVQRFRRLDIDLCYTFHFIRRSAIFSRAPELGYPVLPSQRGNIVEPGTQAHLSWLSAEALEFERAAVLRDELHKLQKNAGKGREIPN